MIPLKKRETIVLLVVMAVLVGALAYKYIIWENSSAEDDRPYDGKLGNNSQHPEKEKIHLKTLDSIDYFQTAEGEFEEFDKEDNSTITVQYVVDTKNKRGISTMKESGFEEQTVIFKDKKKLTFNDNDNTYREFLWEPLPKDKKLAELPPTKRFLGEAGNENRLDDEFLGYSNQSLNSDHAGLLLMYEDWDVTEDKFLNFDVYKLVGNIDEQLSSDLQGKFEMSIEKNSGIVLDFRSFDEEGNVKYYLTTKRIKIDSDISEESFEKDISKYKKVDKVETNK